jgi:hypothetical protein
LTKSARQWNQTLSCAPIWFKSSLRIAGFIGNGLLKAIFLVCGGNMLMKNTNMIIVRSSLLVALAATTGCATSPTYGTGKTANAQLLQDVTESFSLKPKTGPKIAYQPRSELVKTAATELPAPQESATNQEGVWPESPEQKRQRLRAQATAGQNDPNFEPTIVNDLGGSVAASARSNNPNDDRDLRKRVVVDGAAIKKSRVLNAVGSPSQRKQLSEPPIEYRQPVESATYGDLGEDEIKKERRLRAEAKKKNGTGGLKGLIPWL